MRNTEKKGALKLSNCHINIVKQCFLVFVVVVFLEKGGGVVNSSIYQPTENKYSTHLI